MALGSKIDLLTCAFGCLQKKTKKKNKLLDINYSCRYTHMGAHTHVHTHTLDLWQERYSTALLN